MTKTLAQFLEEGHEIKHVTSGASVLLKDGKAIGTARKAGQGWMVSSHVGQIWQSVSQKNMKTSYKHAKTKREAVKILNSMKDH